MEILNWEGGPPEPVLEDLTDDLLGRIFFTGGYLSSYWGNLLDLLLVCKRLKALGQRSILRLSAEANGRMHATWLCVTMPRMVSNLRVLRLDFTFPTEDFPEDFGERIAPLAPSLATLSCRGTSLDDAALQCICQHLPSLTYLDISKSQRALAALVTDIGCESLAQLRGLCWLNLAMTRITDATIVVLADHAHALRHLGLDCCSLLTDECFGFLEHMELETLDVSSCELLTNNAFFKLGNKRSLCRPALRHLLMSYLPLVTFDIVTFLLATFDGLRMLDIKARTGLGEGAPPLERRQAAQARLQAAIFVHGDEGPGRVAPSMYMESVKGQFM